MSKQHSALTAVLEEARGRTGRLPPKVHQTGFVAQNGMTCVMNASPTTQKLFSEPFLAALRRDRATDCFIPVPKEGHHVTLLGLEYALIQTDGTGDEVVAATLKRAQALLNARVSLGTTISMVACQQRKRLGLEMTPSTPSLNAELRAAEDGMKKMLRVPKNKPQSWHMTLGYFKPGTPRAARAEAEQNIRQILSDLLRRIPYAQLGFQHPQICVYKAHNKYTPLFPRLAASSTQSFATVHLSQAVHQQRNHTKHTSTTTSGTRKP